MENLSVELLVETFGYLQSDDLLRCSQVSSRWNKIIRESAYLQYLIALGKAGYNAASRNNSRATSDRLRSLLRTESLWYTLSPQPPSIYIPIPTAGWNGTTLCQDVTLWFAKSADPIRGYSRLKVTKLIPEPAAGRMSADVIVDLNPPIHTFACDPKQDLLVVGQRVQSAEQQPDRFDMLYRFLSLKDGKTPKRSAQRIPLNIKLGPEDEVRTSFLEEYLIIGRRRNMQILYHWPTGQVVHRLQDTENTKYLDACLVPGYVLVSKLEKHPSPTILIDLMELVSTPQMPAPQATEATRSDTPSTTPSFASVAVVTHLRLIASFRLPELSPSLIASPPENVTNANAQIVPTIDSLWADFCPITQGPTRTYTDCDFLPSPVLLVLGMGDGVCRANLIVRLKDILPGGPLLPSVSHAAQNTEDNVEGADVTVLEWEEWGPKYTCLTRRSSSWANVSVIGYRILGWGAYMDFSPYRIHHPHCVPLSTSQADDNVDPTSKQRDEVEVENAETQDVNEAGETQEEQTPHDTLVTKTELDCRALFAHPITTHLPFRERNCDSFIGGPDETILYFYEDVDGPRLVSLVLSAVHDNWPAIQVCKLG